jgi:hypothetical protein
VVKVLDQTSRQISRMPGVCPLGGAFSAKQSRWMSPIIVCPLFDLEVTLGENIAIGELFTI